MTTWKKSFALGAAAFLLGSGAAWAAEPAAVGATYAENAANAPMPLPLTEEEVSAQQLADAEYMALLWMRTSAEYRALCYQGYNAALMAIDRAQANPAARSGKPLAIVLDCDETVTDNTRAMAEAAAAGNGRYDALWWRATVHEARSEAHAGRGRVPARGRAARRCHLLRQQPLERSQLRADHREPQGTRLPLRRRGARSPHGGSEDERQAAAL